MLTMTRFAELKTFRAAALVAMLAAALSAAAIGKAIAEGDGPPGTPSAGQPPPQPSVPPAPSPAAAPSIPPLPPAASKPGLLDQVRAWWDDSIGFFDAKIKDTRGTVDDLNKKSSDAAKGVAVTTHEAVKGALDVSKDAAAVTQGAVKGALDVSKDAAAVTQGAVKGALDASKDAAGAIVRLPNTRVVDGAGTLRDSAERRAGLRARPRRALAAARASPAARRSMFAPRKNVIPRRRCSRASAWARVSVRSNP